MTAPLPLGLAVSVADYALEPLPLEPSQVLAGTPETSIAVLDESPDGRICRGIWQITPGTVTDVEEDELFVVLSGSATVTIDGGEVLELAPGIAGVLRRGARTTWVVHETLRKVFQTTSG